MILLIMIVLLMSCAEDKSTARADTEDKVSIQGGLIGEVGFNKSTNLEIIDQRRKKIKLGHTINTMANEYLPILNHREDRLYFSAMDRTGFFDFKLDFTKQKSSGGEDVFYSDLIEGIWTDARPLITINTNGHEVVSQVFEDGSLLVTANYPEKLGSKDNSNAAIQTTDIFFLQNKNSSFQINHFPEPVNSIFTEADGWMDTDRTFILFVSDRPGHVGEYHKKGWKWNESFWGNTDVYVSLKDGDYWSIPLNLGSLVNSSGSERTPWLSVDGLTLFISSNGYEHARTDLNVYAFKRKNNKTWTEWEGPYAIKDANTAHDDWGYKETLNGDAYLASSIPLGFRPTQGGKGGDAGFRETNYRQGYYVHGLQIASLDSGYETNIYVLKKLNSPVFILNDVFFAFNSDVVNNKYEKYLDIMADLIDLNKDSIIEIHGHTDSQGNDEYNRLLSLERANAIKRYLVARGITNDVVTKGFGDSKPTKPNSSSSNRAMNRRVEIFISNTNR
jgi:outer membrane protein OmpA-like peptidoglycan-associated protein